MKMSQSWLGVNFLCVLAEMPQQVSVTDEPGIYEGDILFHFIEAARTPNEMSYQAATQATEMALSPSRYGAEGRTGGVVARNWAGGRGGD